MPKLEAAPSPVKQTVQSTLPYAKPTTAPVDLAICTLTRICIVDCQAHAATYCTGDVVFPLTPSERSAYLRPNGKPVTEFQVSSDNYLKGETYARDWQWRIYDYIATIPLGRVTTYGAIAKALQSSPRAVGSALRNNPFAPKIPCHRIIASDAYLGGFYGQWGLADVKGGKKIKTKGDGQFPLQKLEMLTKEGSALAFALNPSI